MVLCVLISVVKPTAELNSIGFNTHNILNCLKTYPSKEKTSNKRKLIPEQIQSNEKCSLFKTYRKFLKINYSLKCGSNIRNKTRQ